MSLGERIRKIRKDCALTQNEFAERMLVSASYISKIEAGKEIPSDIFLKLMSLEFNIALDWIKTGDGAEDIFVDKYDYFERNQDYNTDVKKDLVDFQKMIDSLPNKINSSIFFMLEEYSHLLKSEYLTESQKVLIASIISDIFATITEIVDKFFTINRDDEKELLRFESFFVDIRQIIMDQITEIRNTLLPKPLD